MEPVVALGGGRALILQVMHPLVAAGVEQHSNFAADPFTRGFSTIETMLKLTFGEAATSAERSARLAKIHARIEGTSSSGVDYRALDPDLLLWVWATLVDASMRMFELGVRAFVPGERATLYEESKLVAYATGVPVGSCPATLDDFDRYMSRMISSALEVTPVARVVAYAGSHLPLPWPLGAVGSLLVDLVTAGLLTPSIRDALGYRWSPGRQRRFDMLMATLRGTGRLVPRRVREVPNRWIVGRDKPLRLFAGREVTLPANLQNECR